MVFLWRGFPALTNLTRNNIRVRLVVLHGGVDDGVVSLLGRQCQILLYEILLRLGFKLSHSGDLALAAKSSMGSWVTVDVHALLLR
jgi:hypothetical protein